MKIRILTVMLLAVMLLLAISGCSLYTMEERLDDVGDAVENRMDMAEEAVENVVSSAFSPAQSNGPVQPPAATGTTAAVTKEEAEAIALEHAGFTADQVTYLRTEYEIDDGVPQYEVHFHQGRWEYDYEINAQTGAILSYDRDD